MDDMKMLEQKAQQLAAEAEKDKPKPKEKILFVRFVFFFFSFYNVTGKKWRKTVVCAYTGVIRLGVNLLNSQNKQILMRSILTMKMMTMTRDQMVSKTSATSRTILCLFTINRLKNE